MEEVILSDENLVKYIEEEKIKDILSLFSNGRFLELVNKYIMIEENSGQIASLTPEQNLSVKPPTPNIMFSNINMNNNIQKPQPKLILNLDLIEKCNEDKLTQQILLTIFIFCLLKLNKTEDAKIGLDKYIFPVDNIIFPLILLKSKDPHGYLSQDILELSKDKKVENFTFLLKPKILHKLSIYIQIQLIIIIITYLPLKTKIILIILLR